MFVTLAKDTPTIKIELDGLYYKVNIKEENDNLYKVYIKNRAPFCFGKILNAIYKKGAIDKWKTELEAMKRSMPN